MSLNDFDEQYFPAWNENNPEEFLGQLHVIKDLGLIDCDHDLIFGFHAYNGMFEKYQLMTLDQKTNLKAFSDYIRKSFDPNPLTRYPFERVAQKEDENPALYFDRVKAHYFLSRDCPIPEDQRIPEISKSDIFYDYIKGIKCPETRMYLQQNCTQYENLVPMTINFTQSLSDIAESKQMADSEQDRPTQDELHPSVQSSSNCRRSPSRHRRKQTRSKSKRRSQSHQNRSRRK